jgi:TPR repeat protein
VNRSTVLIAVLALTLDGCIASAVRTGVDMADRSSSRSKAEAGDAEAQYKLGQSWCCTLGGWQVPVADAVYDNETATEWLCRAAHQGYGPAQLALARIYADRPAHRSLKARLADTVISAPTNKAAGLMWATLAAASKAEGADTLLGTLTADAAPEDKAEAARMAADWQAAPCTWHDTIDGRTATGAPPAAGQKS